MKFCGKCETQKQLTEFYSGHGKCITCVRIRQLEWYADNKARNYANSRQFKVGNPERTRELHKRERNTPTGKARQRVHNLTRKARKKNAEGTFTPADVSAMLLKQKGCCNLCGCSILFKYHIDHIVALVNSGSNWPTNLQLLCPTCNMRKGAR